MKKKKTPFPFILKIILLGSLLLIGKFSRKENLQFASNEQNTFKMSQDSVSYKVYPQFIFKNVVWRVKE